MLLRETKLKSKKHSSYLVFPPVIFQHKHALQGFLLVIFFFYSIYTTGQYNHINMVSIVKTIRLG